VTQIVEHPHHQAVFDRVFCHF